MQMAKESLPEVRKVTTHLLGTNFCTHVPSCPSVSLPSLSPALSLSIYFVISEHFSKLEQSTLGVESMGGSGSSGNLLKKQLGATHPLEYAGHVTGSGSDEDRFVIVPEIQFGKMEEDVAFICGVFDGHGTSRGDGADFAERAATKLPTWIAERYRELILEKEDGTPIKSPKRMVSKRKSFINNIKTQIPQAMTDAFDRFQVEVHDTYMKQVERQKKEAAEGTDEGRLKKRRASL